MPLPVSEPLVFEGVEDDEGVQKGVTELDGTAELLPGRRVMDRVDDPSMDEDIPFSEIPSSSPLLLDADEGWIGVAVSTV